MGERSLWRGRHHDDVDLGESLRDGVGCGLDLCPRFYDLCWWGIPAIDQHGSEMIADGSGFVDQVCEFFGTFRFDDQKSGSAGFVRIPPLQIDFVDRGA